MSDDLEHQVSTAFPRPIIAGKHSNKNLVKLVRNKTVVWTMDEQKYLDSIHTFNSEEGWKPSYLSDYPAEDGWYYYIDNSTVKLANVKQRRTKFVTGVECRFYAFGTLIETRIYPYGSGKTFGSLPDPPSMGDNWVFLGWDSVSGGYVQYGGFRRFLSEKDVVTNNGVSGYNVINAVWRPKRCLPNGAIITFGPNLSLADNDESNDIDMQQRHRMFINGTWYKMVPSTDYSNFNLIRSYMTKDSRYWVGFNLRRTDTGKTITVTKYRHLTTALTDTSETQTSAGIATACRVTYDIYNVLTGEVITNNATNQAITSAHTYVLTDPSPTDVDGYHQLITGNGAGNAGGDHPQEHSCMSNTGTRASNNTVYVVEDIFGNISRAPDGFEGDKITLTAHHDIILPTGTIMRIYDHNDQLVYQRTFVCSDNLNFVTGVLWIWTNEPYYRSLSYMTNRPDSIAWCSVAVKSMVEGTMSAEIEFSFNMFTHRMEFDYIY